MSKIIFPHSYHNIISLPNLLEAWKEFSIGKRKRKDVQEFERDLMSNLISLHQELKNKTYRHGSYEAFKISDPKPRDIHKATVRDRLLHHALYRKLYPYFDQRFIDHSYSCRKGKGTHKAIKAFTSMARKITSNHTKTAYVLKCDIKKFFANIDQTLLLKIIGNSVKDQEIINLIQVIVSSFNSGTIGVGLPLGNLTSQLFVNIYMDQFDQWVEHKIKAKYYIRYADDFVVLDSDPEYLETILLKMKSFLIEELKLTMHPDKISITTLSSSVGVDFLGFVHFPDHLVLRTATKRRMLSKLNLNQGKEESLQSYLGLLGHGNGWKLQQQLLDNYRYNYTSVC